MADKLSHEMLKVSIGLICQTIGFQGIFSTPLEILIDLTNRYLAEIAKLTHSYCEHDGRTLPNLQDLELAFSDLGISVQELEEYINAVDCPPFPHQLSSYPVKHQSDLNFLKPGAREILSRPIHVHEHLPPMYPEKEDEELSNLGADDLLGDNLPNSTSYSGADPETLPSKRFKLQQDDEGLPVREIESVMMTTSGFISSAREGKLPEPRPPNIPMPAPRVSPAPALLEKVESSSLVNSIKKKVTIEQILQNKKTGPSTPSIPTKKPKPKIPPNSPNKGSVSNTTPLIIPKLKIPSVDPSNKKVEKEKVSKKKEKNVAKKDVVKKEKASKVQKDNTKGMSQEKKEGGKKDKKPKESSKKTKEERKEQKKKKDREKELIAALAASSEVTVTSIPAPLKENASSSKLNIFKKKGKAKPEIDKTTNETSQDLIIKDQSKTMEELKIPKTPHSFYSGDSPTETATPRTPEVPKIVKSSTKSKGHEKKPRKNVQSKILPINPTHLTSQCFNSDLLGRPKTPESCFLMSDNHVPPFSLPPFASTTGFIPPFSPRFPFYPPPFGGPPRPGLIPPLGPFNLSSFLPCPTFEKSSFVPTDEPEQMDKPPTPDFTSCVKTSFPLPDIQSSNNDNVSNPMSPSSFFPAVEKLDKKKMHKKEKKEKDRVKKKKDKKEKEKKKDKTAKLEKKEKKKGKKAKEAVENPFSKLSVEILESPPPIEPAHTPKLVIKPVIKKASDFLNAIASPPRPPKESLPEMPTFSSPEKEDSFEIAKFSALNHNRPRHSSGSPAKKGDKPVDSSTVSSFKIKEVSKSPPPPPVPAAVPILKIKPPIVPPMKLNATKIPEVERNLVKKMGDKKKKKIDFQESFTSTSIVGISRPPSASPRVNKLPPKGPSTSGVIVSAAEPIGHFVDDQGNDIWICPTCGKQDDGSPMIGCDTCNDWYHWVCVGIQVDPGEEVNWYCPRCLSQQRQRDVALCDKKKRGRKKK